MKECSKDSFCSGIKRYLEPSGTRGKGFHILTTMNMTTGDFKTLGISYKANVKDRGVMLNNCPWCGASLEWFN